jgi:hypothetical protein
MGILPRDLREAAEGLFPDGPVVPGSVPLFGERLLSQFAGQSSPVFQTADGDEYRWCETTIEVGSAGNVWPLLTRPCLDPPRPPVRDADGYYAYLKSLPGRFWTRNSPDEIEYAGEVPSRAGSPTSGPSGSGRASAAPGDTCGPAPDRDVGRTQQDLGRASPAGGGTCRSCSSRRQLLQCRSWCLPAWSCREEGGDQGSGFSCLVVCVSGQGSEFHRASIGRARRRSPKGRVCWPV